MNNVEQRAIELYFSHMKLPRMHYGFMWEQCSEEYRDAWRFIASVDLDLVEEK